MTNPLEELLVDTCKSAPFSEISEHEQLGGARLPRRRDPNVDLLGARVTAIVWIHPRIPPLEPRVVGRRHVAGVARGRELGEDVRVGPGRHGRAGKSRGRARSVGLASKTFDTLIAAGPPAFALSAAARARQVSAAVFASTFDGRGRADLQSMSGCCAFAASGNNEQITSARIELFRMVTLPFESDFWKADQHTTNTRRS